VENRQLDHPQSSTTTVLPQFTARERQVLRLLRAGKSNREIAASLSIDPGTVKAHIGRLMRKVGVSNRTALTMHPLTQVE
jgi:DNA-binding NarL/FixJ family response regulator